MKFLSRKFLITIGCLIVAPLLPVFYKSLGISDTITMSVEGILTAALGIYSVANIKDQDPT